MQNIKNYKIANNNLDNKSQTKNKDPQSGKIQTDPKDHLPRSWDHL